MRDTPPPYRRSRSAPSAHTGRTWNPVVNRPAGRPFLFLSVPSHVAGQRRGLDVRLSQVFPHPPFANASVSQNCWTQTYVPPTERGAIWGSQTPIRHTVAA